MSDSLPDWLEKGKTVWLYAGDALARGTLRDLEKFNEGGEGICIRDINLENLRSKRTYLFALPHGQAKWLNALPDTELLPSTLAKHLAQLRARDLEYYQEKFALPPTDPNYAAFKGTKIQLEEKHLNVWKVGNAYLFDFYAVLARINPTQTDAENRLYLPSDSQRGWYFSDKNRLINDSSKCLTGYIAALVDHNGDGRLLAIASDTNFADGTVANTACEWSQGKWLPVLTEIR